jgi:mercuric ion transport protein
MRTGKNQKNLLRVGIIGTIIAALCCSTPILVLLLSAIGLGAVSVYLDYILLPLLAIFTLLTIYGLLQVMKTRK